jgi:hypothetical protein
LPKKRFITLTPLKSAAIQTHSSLLHQWSCEMAIDM